MVALKYQKKGQFLIFSALFLFLLLLFIYSVETDNTYIENSGENKLILNIIEETCLVATLNNGTDLNASLYQFEIDVNDYCSQVKANCTITITNNSIIPPGGNWSDLNHTHYNYDINYSYGGLSFTQTIGC